MSISFNNGMSVREILAAIDRTQFRIDELEYERWLMMQYEAPEGSPAPADEMLSVNQVAAYLHCTRDTVHNLVRRKKIPCVRVGAHWLFSQRAVTRAGVRKHMR